jgi:integrase/recombinase XerD
VTQLRKQMLEELQRRNYSQTTVKGYLKIVEAFAKYFHRSPDRLGPEQIRAYQVYLFTERKLNARTVVHHTAALRFFFFCKTLKRPYPIEEVPYPRRRAACRRFSRRTKRSDRSTPPAIYFIAPR